MALRLLLTLSLVAICPALQASGQDVPRPSAPAVMPSWLVVGGEYRMRVEDVDGARFQADNDDGYVLSRLRVGVTILPSDRWRIVAQVQDAHVFFKAQQPSRPPFQDVVDLRLGYVEVGARKDARIRARIGRQELVFGEQRLIGNADWLNTARTFDAARVTLNRPGVTVDAFGGYALRVMPDQFNRPEPGMLIYGVNAVLSRALPRSTIELYVFARRAPNQAIESGGRDVLDSATIGARWSLAGAARVDAGAEVAGQLGAAGADSVRAWASHWTAGFTWIETMYKPRVFGEYNYASGDDDARDGRRQTFDQLYATGHDKFGLADQVGWKNVHHLRAGAELRPSSRITTTGRYHSWWLASTADALYDAAGSVLVAPPGAAAARHVGQELDLQATLAASRTVRVSVGYAHIFPGAMLRQAVDGHGFSYPFVSVNAGF